jgi:Vacuolar protein sorting-associated protein
MGLLIKPIVGFCDFFAAMFHGIKNSTRYEENVMEIRSRPPRVFGENRLIINYDWSIAKGKAVIRRIKRSKAIEQEQILFYDEINIKVRTGLHPYQVILTDARFIYMRVSLFN